MLGRARQLVVAACLAVGVVSSSFEHDLPQTPLGLEHLEGSQPNIIFIFTDDQDVRMNSLDYMPLLKHHMIDQGTSFPRHYCSIALCCPSRVNLWTGKAPHNTNVTDVTPPYGGYPKFVSQGLNEAWLPIWLQEAGYNTYYVGKLFNAHNTKNYGSPFPKGWTGSDFSLDPFTYQYLNITTQRNRDPPVSHHGEYATDVLAKKAFGFFDDAVAGQKPFFLTIATNAPHSNVEFDESFFNGKQNAHSVTVKPPISAERHKHLFKDVVVPRTPNFNPDEPTGVAWVATLEKLNQSIIDYGDEFYRGRLRALQAVDEIVDGVFARLEEHNLLDNTYIFYSADNGYHISQHRLQPGKECGFEEDINVPFIVRGPGVARGKVSDLVTSHTDLAPTFLTLANAKLRDDFDGAPIPVRTADLGSPNFKNVRTEHANIEYWGFLLSEGKIKYLFRNNTYKGLRLIGPGYNFYYSVFCSGEHELYDIASDPYEINNLYYKDHSSTTVTLFESEAASGVQISLSKLIPRLDALLLILKSCKARTCTHPWESLHKQRNVHSLRYALASKYDHYYEVELDDFRIQYNRCENGYIVDAEGVQGENVTAFDEEFVAEPRGGDLWHELV